MVYHPIVYWVIYELANDTLFPSINTVYLGRRGVVREGDRFKIYLPKLMNDLWSELQGKKVKVYVVVSE